MTANGNHHARAQGRLTQGEVAVGAVILVLAQLSAASTATWVHSLPPETPSVLRGLWRQTLTSMIFGVLCTGLWLWHRHDDAKLLSSKSNLKSQVGSTEQKESDEPASTNERTRLLHRNNNEDDFDANEGTGYSSSSRMALVAMAVIGATLLNDTIVVALQYASSAAVMCLCNTTPIWLILYSILHCGVETPGIVIISGATFALVGAVICATGGEDDDDAANSRNAPTNESLGAMIATFGGMGGAVYMTACRKLAPVGLHPVVLTLIINLGMMVVSFIICLTTLDEGLSLLSADVRYGFWGFLSPRANPAALLHSVFPDCGGNFGIMLALSYFEPLIVSMVMLAEPLNASLIAMSVVREPPPSSRTMLGVAIVLFGCAIVLWESARQGKKEYELEQLAEFGGTADEEETEAIVSKRRSSNMILFSPIGTITPDATAKAAFRRPNTTMTRHRPSLPHLVERGISMSAAERESSMGQVSVVDLESPDRRSTLTASLIKGLSVRFSSVFHESNNLEDALTGRRSSGWSFSLYGSVDEDDDIEQEE